jgi:hypothetical protein
MAANLHHCNPMAPLKRPLIPDVHVLHRPVESTVDCFRWWSQNPSSARSEVIQLQLNPLQKRG